MRLLFFSSLCDRTGAEMALHRLIRNADRTTIKIAVACGARGKLSKDFPADVPVFSYWHALSLADRALNNGGPGVWLADGLFNGMVRLIHERVRPDAWYINTILQPKLLALARDLGVPCILHTHEQEHMFSLLKVNDIENIISYPKLIIAASNSAAEILSTLGRRENVEICYPPIDLKRIDVDGHRSNLIRQELKIPSDAFVWAMVGTRDPNKNPVNFVRIVTELAKRESRAHFLWIGGADTGYSLYAKALAERSNIHDRISWVLERHDDYFDYLNIANGLALTSVHDTLPLVLLECAALGRPFVSFNSGGANEIFRDGMGAVLDSWNPEDMVAAMLQIMHGEIHLDPDISKARSGEFDVSVIVKRWERIIGSY